MNSSASTNIIKMSRVVHVDLVTPFDYTTTHTH
jgi:hypothetical protein